MLFSKQFLFLNLERQWGRNNPRGGASGGGTQQVQGQSANSEAAAGTAAKEHQEKCPAYNKT